MYNGGFSTEDLRNDRIPKISNGVEVEMVEKQRLSFFKAARYGNYGLVRKYLHQYKGRRKKINKLDKHELTALHYAVRYGHINVINLLVENRANIHARGLDGAQPIHFAARHFKRQKHTENTPRTLKKVLPVHEEDFGHFMRRASVIKTNNLDIVSASNVVHQDIEVIDVINYLLSNEADINAIDDYNQTPLNYAAIKGNTDAMAILLEWPGIDKDIVDTSGGTALHNACGNGHVMAAKLLLMAEAKLMVFDNEGRTPLHYAASNDDPAVIKMILNDIEEDGGMVGDWSLEEIINHQNSEDESILHNGIFTCQYEACALMVEKGADVNLCRNGFVTPLHLAAATGDMRIIKLLVSAGANIKAKNIYMETPLHKAASFNRIPAMEFLLTRGCDANAFDQDSRTPLVIAAANRNKEAAEMLLKYGADMSVVDTAEKSAIYWAADENATKVLEVLLEHITTSSHETELISKADVFENTPMHAASKKGYKHVVRMLLEAGADQSPCNDEELTPLHLAVINGNNKVSTILLKSKPSIINDEDESGNSALHLAALHGHHKLIDLLVRFGASVDVRNALMWTPLDCAAAKGHVKCVSFLLERDSPLDPLDLASTTPLHLASKEGHKEVVEVLLEKGADVTLTDHMGKNALDMAIEKSRKDVALTLLEHKEWLQMMKNRSRLGEGVTTPMRELIKKLPDVAFLVLNKCMKTPRNTPVDHPEFYVQFFYDLLDDTYADWLNEGDGTSVDVRSQQSGSSTDDENDANVLTPVIQKHMEKKDNHPLAIMCSYRRDKLLGHPLVMSLIYAKWGKYGRLVFYSKFCLYFIFILFFTGYVLVSAPLSPLQVGDQCHSRVTQWDQDQPEFVVFHTVGKYVVIVLGGIQLFMELMQLVTRTHGYIKDPTNLMEWVIYLLAIIYCLFDIERPDPDHFISCDTTQRSVGCCSIFLAWINLLLFLQKFPTLGIYVVMFTDVLKTFMRFSLTFILFIVAFALGFFVLLQGGQLSTFDNFGRASMKTVVMMIGEFDYADMFGDNQPPLLTWFLFFIFVVVVTILLMNLMVGLAVDDIKGVLDQAVLTRVAMQVNLVLDVEKILPRNLRQRTVSNDKLIYPNKDFSWWSVIVLNITTRKDVEQALFPEKSVSDIVEEHTESIRASVDKLKSNFKEMSKQTKNIEQMLEELMKHQNVQNDFDDDW